MLGINELLEKLKAGEFADAFQSCEDIDEFVAKAKELGYEVSSEDIEAATDLSDEALESVAGGVDWFPTNMIKCTC